MDGFGRYVTIYPLKSKTDGEVNDRMQDYIAWAKSRRHFYTGTAVLHIDVGRVEHANVV